MRLLVAMMAGVLALAACAPKDPILFDGEYFRTKSRAVSDDRRTFSVEVRAAAGREAAALKAARYEATLYCMDAFATSDMVWTVADEEVGLTEEGDLFREGECASR